MNIWRDMVPTAHLRFIQRIELGKMLRILQQGWTERMHQEYWRLEWRDVPMVVPLDSLRECADTKGPQETDT